MLAGMGHRPMTGERLRAWRKGRGWSREQLAKRLGVNVRTIVRWELEETTPTGAGAKLLKGLNRLQGG
jgi:transcriptional regulator with XRE-family HTH domain